MSVGAAGALNSLFKAILSEGDNVIVPSPFFTEYRHYVHNYGGNLIEVPAKPDFSLDVDAISATLTEKTAAVLINSPNNPTGRIYSNEEIKNLLKFWSFMQKMRKKTVPCVRRALPSDCLRR